MIVTLTPNPSIDRTVTWTRRRPRRGAARRLSASDPGGKGVNVARASDVGRCRPSRVLPAAAAIRCVAALTRPGSRTARADRRRRRINITITSPTAPPPSSTSPGRLSGRRSTR